MFVHPLMAVGGFQDGCRLEAGMTWGGGEGLIELP